MQDLENHMVIGDYYREGSTTTVSGKKSHDKFTELQQAEHNKKIKRILKEMKLEGKWRELYGV